MADKNPAAAPPKISRNQCTPQKTLANPTKQDNIIKTIARGML